MLVNITTRNPMTALERLSKWRCTDGFGSQDEDVFHVEFDGAEERLSEVIPRAVATILDEDPTDLEPLGTVIDPDMLNAIGEHGSKKSGLSGDLTFQYEGFEITVAPEGHIWFERL